MTAKGTVAARCGTPRRYARAACMSARLHCRSLPVPCVPARLVRPDPAAFALPQRSRPDRRFRRSGLWPATSW